MIDTSTNPKISTMTPATIGCQSVSCGPSRNTLRLSPMRENMPPPWLFSGLPAELIAQLRSALAVGFQLVRRQCCGQQLRLLADPVTGQISEFRRVERFRG